MKISNIIFLSRLYRDLQQKPALKLTHRQLEEKKTISHSNKALSHGHMTVLVSPHPKGDLTDSDLETIALHFVTFPSPLSHHVVFSLCRPLVLL